MKARLKSEAKQLHLIIGKLVGGITAVTGFGGAVAVLTRRPDPSWGAVLPWVSAGIIGLALFLAASRWLAKRAEDEDMPGPGGKDQAKTSALSWIILLVLVALFLAIVVIVAA
ncbi:MAG: hypothetical protein PHC90_03420 [Syntrophorhabdaceae bacterium]|nr:hypothetical protein [Syntrophorhabdaceae bacterium]